MKSLITKIAVFCGALVFSFGGSAQSDTLHLNYHHTQIKPHDTTVAKIDKWAKSLAGKHVDIRVIAYYHKLEFKKFSDQRLEELFIVLNRKARALITIVEQDSKKGKDYQRTMVDIIYTPTMTEEQKKAKADAEAAEAKKVAEAKKAANAEKAAKEKEEKAAKESAKGESGEKKSKTDVAKEQTEKGDAKKSKDEKDEKGEKGKREKDDEDRDVSYSSVVKFNEGGPLTHEEIKYIQRAKFIVAQTGKGKIDELFVNAVKDWWKLNSDISVMTYDEARKLCDEKKKDTIVILSVAQVKTWFEKKSFGFTYKILKIGRALALENTKGKVLFTHVIPSNSETGISPESMNFGVSTMNYCIEYMLSTKMRSSSDMFFLVDENAKELQNKPIVIAESMKHPKLPPEEIPSYYKGKISWVSDERARDIILKKKDEAYIMPVLLPSHASNYLYYIVNGATGKIYLLDEGPAFQLSLNPTPGAANTDASQSGYVDKANLQRFNEVVYSDAELDLKRSARAAKEREKVEEKEKEELAKAEKAKAKKANDSSGDKKEKSSKSKDKEKKDTDSESSGSTEGEKEVKKDEKSKKKKEDKSTESSDVEKEVKEEVKKEEKSKKKKEDKKTKKTDEEKTEETKPE